MDDLRKELERLRGLIEPAADGTNYDGVFFGENGYQQYMDLVSEARRIREEKYNEHP